MDFHFKRHIENNELYIAHERTIDSIQNAIRREVPHLIQEFHLSVEETDTLNEFIQDRATLFRFLRKNNYSLPTALSLLLDTIRWRIMANIDNIRIPAISEDFLTKPLVYFHKTDKVNRPVLMVHLAYLPKAPVGTDVTEFLTPLVVFVLETARLLTWDMTKERIEANVDHPVILDTMVLVDFKNASSLPTDMNLFKSFITLLRRYPGLTGTVNFINFGWMYQGLWQMCKLVLSNEAKSKINFPKRHELLACIQEQDLIIDLGGTDPFEWHLSSDAYYNKYRNVSPCISRRSSTSSIYYDTHSPLLSMTLTRPPSSFSLYATPRASLTPVASHNNLASVAKAYSSLSLQSKIGNGRLRTTIKQLGDLFVVPPPADSPQTDLVGGVPSWVLSEKLSDIRRQQQEEPDTGRNFIKRLMMQFNSAARHITLRILKKMVHYRGTLYWIVACVLLRNGVQELLQHLFLLMMEVMLIGKPSAARNAVGMRSLLSLTTGQMTL